MSIQTAGAIIREARQKAGLTQEELSEGICSALSLSRIENGTAGVYPSTFQALMAHAGASCEAYPIFANRTDFDCFYALKRARFYLDCWQLKEVSDELNKIEARNFAKNKYYYQEWLLLHSKLHFRSGCGNHRYIYDTLLEALHISRPELDFSDFRGLLLSLIEIELLIDIAQETLYLNKPELCLQICTQISSYLENSQLSFLEKDKFLAEYVIVYSKYLIAEEDYSNALKLAEKFRQKTIKNDEGAPLHELTFLTGLALYHAEKKEEALLLFKTAFFSAHSIGSCYATTIKQYLEDKLNMTLYDATTDIREIPLVPYNPKQVIDTSDLSEGIYDLFSPETLTLGGLIRELRMEQHLSQQTLCQGLCSKSKLSKIESGEQQPNIALAQSLLQRLGISDTVFTFYGSEHEEKLHQLRLQLTLTLNTELPTIQKHIDALLQECKKEDKFYLQYAAYKKAVQMEDKEKSAEALMQTLQITLPGFSMSRLENYRLSWLEATILNNYCNTYSQFSPAQGIFTMYQLLNYYATTPLDILEKKRFSIVLLTFLSSALYHQKRFSDLTELIPQTRFPEVKSALRFMSSIYANYSQALGEVKQFDKVSLTASYAYYNCQITNRIKSAERLKYWIFEDFNITLF